MAIRNEIQGMPRISVRFVALVLIICLVVLALYYFARRSSHESETVVPSRDGFAKTIVGQVFEDAIDSFGIEDPQERDLLLNNNIVDIENAANVVVLINRPQEPASTVSVIEVDDTRVPFKFVRTNFGEGSKFAIFFVARTDGTKVTVSERAFILVEGSWKAVAAEVLHNNAIGRPSRVQPRPDPR